MKTRRTSSSRLAAVCYLSSLEVSHPQVTHQRNNHKNSSYTLGASCVCGIILNILCESDHFILTAVFGNRHPISLFFTTGKPRHSKTLSDFLKTPREEMAEATFKPGMWQQSPCSVPSAVWSLLLASDVHSTSVPFSWHFHRCYII